MGNIYICEDCEKVCDLKEIENEYEVASPYDYSGCHSETELIDVSDCCEADYKEVDEDEHEASLSAANDLCGRQCGEMTLTNHLKDLLVTHAKFSSGGGRLL